MPLPVFVKLTRFVGAKDGGRLDFVVASRDEEAGVHTVKDVDVEFVTTLCTYAPFVWTNDAATSAVDGFTILVQPFTDSLKAVEGKGGKSSTWLWTDIEEEIGILSSSTNKHLNQLFW